MMWAWTSMAAAPASEASGRRRDSMVRAHSASEDARKRADDTRPEPGSSARGRAELLVIPRSLVYNAIRWYRIMSRSQWTKKSSGARGRTGADVAIQASYVSIAAGAARRARRRRHGLRPCRRD